MSDMREINADISQRFFISLILFLFFNASLIEKCEALKIKIKVLDFINDINILTYNKFIEEICRTLSKAHDICAKWARTHDATFASEKYELTHFIRKSKKFDMMTSIQIESSVIKLKSDVQVLKVQLNMKLQWNVHLCQIEANHVTWMLALSQLEVFTWETIFTKARQILSSSKIRNCIRSISLTSARKRERTVRQRMQAWNTIELDSASHCKDVQKSKHQDSESRNVYKLAACSSEHAARQDHVTQSSWWSYAEN